MSGASSENRKPEDDLQAASGLQAVGQTLQQVGSEPTGALGDLRGAEHSYPPLPPPCPAGQSGVYASLGRIFEHVWPPERRPLYKSPHRRNTKVENDRRTKVTGKGKKKKTTGLRFLLSFSFQKVISDSGTITFFQTFQRSMSKTKGFRKKKIHFYIFPYF